MSRMSLSMIHCKIGESKRKNDMGGGDRAGRVKEVSSTYHVDATVSGDSDHRLKRSKIDTC